MRLRLIYRERVGIVTFDSDVAKNRIIFKAFILFGESLFVYSIKFLFNISSNQIKTAG